MYRIEIFDELEVCWNWNSKVYRSYDDALAVFDSWVAFWLANDIVHLADKGWFPAPVRIVEVY
jgi:hypothetical protein